MSKQLREVGRIVDIIRFPVKSMIGEPVIETKIGWHGLQADRRYAFLKLEDASGLPWLSARDFPGLLAYRASFENPHDPDKSRIVVASPAGNIMPLNSKELLRELELQSGKQLKLIQLWRGAFDSMPISLVSRASILSIAGPIETDLDPARFRANLLVDAVDDHPFPEDRWLNKLVVCGDRPDSARLRVCRRDLRCSIVNVDPSTLRSERKVLNYIVNSRKNQLGVYMSTERPGTAQVGDILGIPTD